MRSSIAGPPLHLANGSRRDFHRARRQTLAGRFSARHVWGRLGDARRMFSKVPGGPRTRSVVVTNAIDDLVREPSDSQLPAREPALSCHADFRVPSNQINRPGDSVVEISTQTRSSLLIPPDRGCQLVRGGFAELERFHRPRRSRSIRRRTSSQGSRAIVPASIAAMRR